MNRLSLLLAILASSSALRKVKKSHSEASTLLTEAGPSSPFPAFDAGQYKYKNSPELLPYDPHAQSTAVVIASDNMARFTVLTPRLIRMEYAKQKGRFEDRATIAVLNRNLPVPTFTSGENGGVLTITTSEVSLQYVVGQGPFTASVSVIFIIYSRFCLNLIYSFHFISLPPLVDLVRQQRECNFNFPWMDLRATFPWQLARHCTRLGRASEH